MHRNNKMTWTKLFVNVFKWATKPRYTKRFATPSTPNSLVERHQAMVRHLVKPAETLQDSSTAFKWALLHPTLGIAGEITELLYATDSDNFLEEAGDLLFYIQDLRDQAGLAPYFSFPDTEDPIDLCAGHLVDLVKRVVIYGQPFDEERKIKLYHLLDLIEGHLRLMLELRGFSHALALTHNIDKLYTGKKARYASGYSDKAAAERADKLKDN